MPRSVPPDAVRSTVVRLGANIAEARKRRGWTQSQLAEKAGITRETLRHVEGGALGTAVGSCVALLWALGLEAPVALLAARESDPEGEALSAARRGGRRAIPGVADDDF